MNEITIIGNDLVEFAEQEAEFTAQRGLLDDLFPFIYVASKRMSLRAICRWLAEKHRIQISPNAVAKAMREQESYWKRLVEDVEDAACTFSDAYNVPARDILDDEELFKEMEVTIPVITDYDKKTDNKNEDLDQSYELADAARAIRNRWFSMPKEARDQCRRHFARVFAKVKETKQAGGKNESGK